MAAPNPYAAPQTPYVPPGAGGALQAPPGSSYVPLAVRTTLVAISVFGMTLASIGMHAAQLAFADQPKATAAIGRPALDTSTLVVGLLGLLVFFFSIACWITIPVWMHRASSNLRGLGRYGMKFSPGACAGWFFVPFANLVLPPQAMSELWKASDPELPQGSWFASKGTELVAVWWATYLIAGVGASAGLFTKDPGTQGGIGIVESGFRMLAAIALVMIMRGVQRRQEQAASRTAEA